MANSESTKFKLTLIDEEVLYDTTYLTYEDELGNTIVLEDGVITMINDHHLDSMGNIE